MVEPRVQRPRIADVAREAGVSKTAVSFAFNAPDRLAPDTAERIRGVAQQLGYTPHPVARMLTQRRTRAIGVLTPRALSVVFGDPCFATFSGGVARVAEQHGYALHFISPIDGSLSGAMTRATVDGVIAVGLAESHPEIDDIRHAGLPLVVVDSTALPDHAAVVIDEVAAAREAGAHLAGLGHRDVLVLAVEPPAPGMAHPDGVTARRLRGYRAAFEEVGVRIDDDHVILEPASIAGGAAAIRKAWQTGMRPTAILAMSDALAIGAMSALRQLGHDIPADVSIVGFDDLDVAVTVDPPLTTVHQPVEEKGEQAASVLIAAIERPSAARPEQRWLDTWLVVRGSTGPGPRRGAP